MSHEPKTNCHAEGADQCAGNGAVPMWLVVFFALSLYGGLLYVERYGGDFNAMVYAPYRNVEDLERYKPMEKVDPLFKRGEQLYAMTCAACHQATGVGAVGQCPPLVGSEWVLQKDPARIIRLIQLGGGGPITVSGVQHNPSVVMPPLGSALPVDDDLAAVLTYVRQSWGNKAVGVTPAQVKKVRSEMGDRKDSWTAAELLKVPVAE